MGIQHCRPERNHTDVLISLMIQHSVPFLCFDVMLIDICGMRKILEACKDRTLICRRILKQTFLVC